MHVHSVPIPSRGISQGERRVSILAFFHSEVARIVYCAQGSAHGASIWKTA